MQERFAPPPSIDVDKPSAARVYDYYLGGDHNFAVDREMAEQAIEMWPDLPWIMQANRAFLRRAVRYCLQQGVRQFLDLGSGIPTAGNVHEVAHDEAPDARVVYVDNDPIAVAYSAKLLRDNPNATVVEADLRDPEAVLHTPEANRLLDWEQPVAVMMVAVLHFIQDSDQPAAIIAGYRDAVAPGSFLVVSHASQEGQPERADAHQDLYRQRTTTPMTMRTRAQVTELFGGFDLVVPGIVYLPLWRPTAPDDVDDHPERFTGLAAVGRKPPR